MFRNQYDSDCTTWSPQGRLHQIEYAMEAVKQGSATIGLKSETHAVLVALKRAQNDLSAHQKKILRIADHIGIAMAGLTADGRSLSNLMRNECLSNEYAFDEKLPVSRLVGKVASKSQILTQRYGRRPYGVGLLVAGYDEQGPHIFQTCPSANFYNCRAMSIGARSQSARTYLEKHLESFDQCDKEALVKHGLCALRETLPTDTELSKSNVSVGIVGKDEPLTIYDDDQVQQFLDLLDSTKKPTRASDEEKKEEETKEEEPKEEEKEEQMETDQAQ